MKHSHFLPSRCPRSLILAALAAGPLAACGSAQASNPLVSPGARSASVAAPGVAGPAGAPGIPHPATATALAQRLEVPAAGFALWLPAGTRAEVQGAAATILPPPLAGSVPGGELWTASAIPWASHLPLEEPSVAQHVVGMLLQSLPGLRLEAAVERLGPSRGDGILLRCVLQGPAGESKVRFLARDDGRTMVTLMAMGDEATLARREGELRAVIRSVEVRPSQPQQAAYGYAAPTYAGANPGPQAQPVAAGALDPSLIGAWATESAMSSPAPWNDLAQGGTNFVTRTVYEFRPDGTYVLGSQAAGGNMDVSYQSGGGVSSYGRWSVVQRPDAQGVPRTYVSLVDAAGNPSFVRYTFHNGQLVIGEAGSRSFWSRVR